MKVSQRWRKSTKQIATLGPSSNTFEKIEQLFLSGADTFRLNYSHGGHEEKGVLLGIIREIEKKYNHPIAILGDLQGPKLRVGKVRDGVNLEKGKPYTFDLDPLAGGPERCSLPHPEIIEASEPGHVLLIDDGKMKLRVTSKTTDSLTCDVEVGGPLKSNKGVNTPDSILELSPLTKKDRLDLEHMIGIGVDWVALSFVQRAADIAEMKELIASHLDVKAKASGLAAGTLIGPSVMAKIEKPSCFKDDTLEEIVQLCDSLMIARGDLGVEMPPEDVPILQKRIIERCRSAGKVVVVATQMLESMIDNHVPTRAEASDVATAIYDGADAIMLSGESAAGDYPVEAVTMQQRIINRVENDENYRDLLSSTQAKWEERNKKEEEADSNDVSADAITLAARSVATKIKAKALVCFTLRGSTVQRASKGRPDVPILAITPHKETSRQLALSWGVYAAVTETQSDDFDAILQSACRAALQKGLVTKPEDLLVVTAGLPFGTPGAANVLRVLPAAGPLCWDGHCLVQKLKETPRW